MNPEFKTPKVGGGVYRQICLTYYQIRGQKIWGCYRYVASFEGRNGFWGKELCTLDTDLGAFFDMMDGGTARSLIV